MAPNGDKERDDALAAGTPEIIRRIRERTSARILVGRAGASYRTETQIGLRAAHAAARDAVRAEINLKSQFGNAFAEEWNVFEAETQAQSKDEFLMRPDLGRRFTPAAREGISMHCPHESDFQVAIGDGLSVAAVAAQVQNLLPLLISGAKSRGWRTGQPVFIRHCRVGILNEIGELLGPRVVVLLIGERPGLATAESLSAYMAYRPRPGHSDAERNLISNIHARGTSVESAAERILNLAAQMMAAGRSGCELKERAWALD